MPQGNSTIVVPSVTSYFMKTSLTDNSRKCILPKMIGETTLIMYGRRHFQILSKCVFHNIKNNFLIIAGSAFYQIWLGHEFHETCHSVTFLFVKKTHFLILAGSAFYQIKSFGKMHFLLLSENQSFCEIKYDEMTSFMEFMSCSS